MNLGQIKKSDLELVMTVSPQEALAFHLVSEHADPVAIERSQGENLARHHHEHYGPCGIRLHVPQLNALQNYLLLIFSEAKVEEVLEEAEEADYGFTRNELPNGMPKDHFWRMASCADRVKGIGAH